MITRKIGEEAFCQLVLVKLAMLPRWKTSPCAIPIEYLGVVCQTPALNTLTILCPNARVLGRSITFGRGLGAVQKKKNHTQANKNTIYGTSIFDIRQMLPRAADLSDGRVLVPSVFGALPKGT